MAWRFPLSLTETASVATILSATAGGVVWAVRASAQRRKRAERDPRVAAKMLPLQVELTPIWFEVSLRQTLPEVMILLRAVNYLRKELTLEQVRVEYFHVNQGPPLDNIAQADVVIPPQQSREVYCRRRLIESETQVFGNMPVEAQYSGSIRVSARGKAGRRQITYQPGATFVIRGYVDRAT